MSGPVYDVIVVGAGIEGSSTAYNLAKRGQNTLLLEQFLLPHNRGSSHGSSRITRKAYPQEYYTHMMMDSYDMWQQLEVETGVKLFHNCGALFIGPPASMTTVEESMKKYDAPFRKLSREEVLREFPSFSLPSDYIGIYDTNGGILIADKALRAYQSQFQAYGGTLLDGQHVTDITPGDVTIVRTQTTSYRTRNVVLALGPYTNKLLSKLNLQLPLNVERISVFYWKEKVPGMHSSERFPCFIEPYAASGSDVYSLPCYEYPDLIKICLHTGPVVDPDDRDKVDSSWVKERMCKYVGQRLPWVENKPSIEDVCLYTVSPDGDLTLDRHPQHDNIIIAAGFSGHGFKLSPAVGKILGDMVLHETPNVDMKHFKLSRFGPGTKAKQARL